MSEVDPNKLVEMMEGQSFLIQDPEEYFETEIGHRIKMNKSYVSLIEFAKNYKNICSEIAKEFAGFAERNKIKVGRLKIVWVGGRIENKPLKDDSDIDLVFFVDSGEKKLSASWREIYSEVATIFRHKKIRITLDDFHFGAIYKSSDIKKQKGKYCVLFDETIN